jgi:hypothetical protein
MEDKEKDTPFTVEEIAHRLLSDKAIGSFSHLLMGVGVGEDDFEDKIDMILYNFEMLQDISMEILHQYLFLISLMKNEEEGITVKMDNLIEFPNDIESMDGEVIEKLLQIKFKKINMLVFVHNVPEDINDYYTRIMFYDTCPRNLKKNFKDKKYHYFINKDWESHRSNIKSIDDVFSVFSLNGNTYSLKFSTINETK